MLEGDRCARVIGPLRKMKQLPEVQAHLNAFRLRETEKRIVRCCLTAAASILPKAGTCLFDIHRTRAFNNYSWIFLDQEVPAGQEGVGKRERPPTAAGVPEDFERTTFGGFASSATRESVPGHPNPHTIQIP